MKIILDILRYMRHDGKLLFYFKEDYMKRVFVVMMVLVFSLFLCQSVFAVDRPGPESEIKVGTLMGLTGPLKDLGPAIQDGAVLAAEQLTDAGLTVKMVHEDSETAPIAGASAARKLVNIDQVAELGTIPGEVILISPASTNPMMTDLPADRRKDFLFRTCPSDALQGVVAGQAAAEMVKTASILYVNNAYGQGLSEVFKSAFEKNGGRVLAMVPHDEKGGIQLSGARQDLFKRGGRVFQL
jgi:ABC-type branched-subunit amino acid transport system substrate-binding protein